MKLKEITIKTFKRFTHLKIKNIPESARLIMLAGPNGCGKSSFFDALHVFHGMHSEHGINWDIDYYHKKGTLSIGFTGDEIQCEFHNESESIVEKRKRFYFRSAYRNDPEFQINIIEKLEDPLAANRFSRMIDNDAAVARNFRQLASQALEDVFDPNYGSMTLQQYRESIIGDIRKAFCRLFPYIELNSLGNPLQNGTFRFTKGASRGFSFKNLSGGEKSAFDLILDLVVARRAYDNTIFCIDEPESHMNAKLQAELLSVLYNLIPDDCQLVLATHSIGMMRRARDIESKHTGSVVFLDFGDLDFDVPQLIEPIIPDRAFWARAYGVALDDLAALIAPDRIIICEGEPVKDQTTSNQSLDAICYNRIFEVEFPETRFVSMGNDRQIIGDQQGLATTLRLLFGGLDIIRLIDRDDRTDTEVAELASDIRVLSLRNLESYLFDDEVLIELAVSKGMKDQVATLLAKKKKIREAKPNCPIDDLKPVSGEIYIACKRTLNLSQCGNTTKAFMRDTLAPLVKPDMEIYNRLKRDIFSFRQVQENQD